MTLKEKYDSPEDGYYVERLPYDTKRVCLAVDLQDDPELIAKYKHYHSPAAFWKEIGEGIRKAGISVMDIYRVDTRLFMICEVPVDTPFDEAWNAQSRYERQDEWNEFMRGCQKALPGHKLEWVKMERVFELPK